MPICKREGFDNGNSKNKNQTFHDNDDVFYCEVTKEIFRDYEDYFKHVMAINSTVWQCEATGKENLTYAEALKSERTARKKMEQFKECLRAPTIMVIDEAKQSSVKQLIQLVFKFLRRRYFKNEEVQALAPNGKYLPYVVTNIVPPDSSPPPNGVYENTEKLRYKILRKVEGQVTSEEIVNAEHVRRARSDFTAENLEMFIRNNITRVDGILRANPESYKKYVTDEKITFSSIFIGKLPAFIPAKIKKQTSIKSFVTKEDKEAMQAKRAQEYQEKKQFDAEQKQKRLLEAELRRTKMQERIEEECKELLQVTDDLERNDQLMLPKFEPLKTSLPSKLVGDCILLREFINSFRSNLCGIKAVDVAKLKFHEFTHAFMKREVAGPLTDITCLLLGTIFDFMKEEMNDYDVSYNTRILSAEREPMKSMMQAAKVHHFINRHYCLKANELPIDAMTLSEVLRLHLLSSGASVSERTERLRLNYRAGYSSSEDPGLYLRMTYPHILRTLKMYTLYQLPLLDIMRILNCLVDQLLTYPAIINVVEDRKEHMAEAQAKLRKILADESKRLQNLHKQKADVKTEHLQQCKQPEVAKNAQMKATLEAKYEKRLADLEATDESEKRSYKRQLQSVHTDIFRYITFLGMDRAYRKYYVLESMPGVFVEHPTECYDTCLPEPPVNLPPKELQEHLTTLREMPKNRKDLRSYLLKKYTEEEKTAKVITHNNNNNNNNNNIKKYMGSNENKENVKEEKLTNGHVVATTNGDIKTEEESEIADDEKQVSQYDLYMCTGDRKNCIVHDERNPDRQRWSYICEKEDLEALIATLNTLGERESQLRTELDTLKNLILLHTKKFPADALENERPKYNKWKSNGSSENLDINEYMHNALVERILQFEHDIYTGDLGTLKVKDMAKWRKDLRENNYEPQGKLCWGPPQQKLAANGEAGVQELQNNNEEEEEDDDIREKAGKYASTPYMDPGVGLGDNLEIDSEDSGDEGISLHDSATLRSDVKNIASALLQIEQAIESRFLKTPFGSLFEKKNSYESHDRLKQWEVSLMECTSYSQVFLHLNVLHDNIIWARSTNKSYCQICRRVSDPEKMLLCDECNGGTHMYCLKPKLKTVPEGNWYCGRCKQNMDVQEETKPKTTSRRRRLLEVEDVADDRSDISGSSSNRQSQRGQRQKKLRHADIEDMLAENDNNAEEQESDEDNEAVEEEEDAEEEEDEEGEEEDEEEKENEEESVCTICSYDGGDLVCVVCKDAFHLECVNRSRPPRYDFVCPKCKKFEDKKRKLKSLNDSGDDSEQTDNSDMPLKRMRSSRSSRNSALNGSHNDTVKSSGRRSNRRTGENLPLNSPVLYALLEDIMKQEQAWPFLRPVMQSEVPDYYKIIKYPMDFAKVKSKLNMGEYQLNEEVMSDIHLIFNNCDQYNVKGNEIYENGAALERFVIKRCKELNLPFRPSDMNS